MLVSFGRTQPLYVSCVLRAAPCTSEINDGTAPSRQKRLIPLSARRLLVTLLVTSHPGPIKVTKQMSISEIILEFECGVDRTGKANVLT